MATSPGATATRRSDMLSSSLNLPEIPPSVPRRYGPALRAFGRMLLRISGFRIRGEFPDLSKAILVAAPHTSNWDFVYGIATVWALGLDVHWVGKHTLFNPLMRRFMLWLGGIPVDRRRSAGTVTQVADALNQSDRMLIAVAPEGTRKKVEYWKKGFYHIAHQAGVPTVPIGMDYATRSLIIGAPLVPCGDFEADMKTYSLFYSAIRGRYPEQQFPQPQ